MNTSNFPHLEYVELMLEKTLGNKELARVLFEKLFITLPIQFNDLSGTLKENDISKAKQIAHDIHGVFASCGLVNLEYYAQKVENYLSVEDEENAQKIFHILKDQIGHFLGCQEEILASLQLQ